MSMGMKLGVAAVLAAALGGAVYYFGAQGTPTAKAPVKPTEPEKPGKLSDEERLAYLKNHVKLHDLRVDPDTRPDDAAVIVPGLLRVSGTIENGGDKILEKATLYVHMKSNEDKVIGSYNEDVLAKKAIGPGERSTFKFTIPDKKEYSGKFLHSLR